MTTKKGFYSQVPHVKSPKKIAGTNPVGTVEHPGGRMPKMVPGHLTRHPPGRTTGLGEPHGWGHAPHQHKGALRISGYANAHQVGFKPPHVQAIPGVKPPRKAGPIGKHGLPKLPKL